MSGYLTSEYIVYRDGGDRRPVVFTLVAPFRGQYSYLVRTANSGREFRYRTTKGREPDRRLLLEAWDEANGKKKESQSKERKP